MSARFIKIFGDDSSIGLVGKMTPVGMISGVLWGVILDNLGEEGCLLAEKNWILQLGKGPPRAPAAREAVVRTHREGCRPPDPHPAPQTFLDFVSLRNVLKPCSRRNLTQHVRSCYL